MKFREAFVIEEPVHAVWEFIEQIDRVARCAPGYEGITVGDRDNCRVRLTQSVGPVSATFDLKVRVVERDPGKSMRFSAIGRSVRGSAGNMRSTNTVRLEETEEGTRVLIDIDVAFGGVLGSVGQRVVARRSSKVTGDFAQALQRELRGETDVTMSSRGIVVEQRQ
jgi:carbon monoxide dehydrogenase subunit G